MKTKTSLFTLALLVGALAGNLWAQSGGGGGGGGGSGAGGSGAAGSGSGTGANASAVGNADAAPPSAGNNAPANERGSGRGTPASPALGSGRGNADTANPGEVHTPAAGPSATKKPREALPPGVTVKPRKEGVSPVSGLATADIPRESPAPAPVAADGTRRPESAVPAEEKAKASRPVVPAGAEQLPTENDKTRAARKDRAEPPRK